MEVQNEKLFGTNTGREDIPLLKVNLQEPPKSLKQKALALCKSPHRLWSTSVIAFIVATLTMIGGYSLGYPSSALLDLRNMTNGRAIESGSVLENVFGVSVTSCCQFIFMVFFVDAGHRPSWIIIWWNSGWFFC